MAAVFGVHAVRLAALCFALSLAACATGGGPRMNLAPVPDGEDVERQVFAAVNAHRAARRLPRLEWSEAVAGQARQHSRRMASGATSLGHRDFRKRARAIGETIPYRQAAENVAKTRSAARAVELWLGHRGHRKNIEGRFDVTGVGAARDRDGWIYLTQIFIESR